MSGREGIIFILTNDAMPGFARVESTTKNDVPAKVRKINKSALPVPFRLYFAARVGDIALVDRNLHFLFADHCESRDSQFFKINPDLLRAAIELAANTIVEIEDKELGISPKARSQMQHIRASHAALRFEALNAEPGSSLSFVKDRTISCTALGNGLVEFEGEALPPAQASLKAMHKIGFDWGEVSPTAYWTPTSGVSAKGGSDEVIPPDLESEIPEVPIVPNDADDSPVMFIRNKKA